MRLGGQAPSCGPHRGSLGALPNVNAPVIPFGRYELHEKIAMGGMAEVYRARTPERNGFSKEVCIKRILPQHCQDESFVRMFIDEATLAARLQHANIVQIFD